MAKYLSGREPYFRVGIDSTTDDLTSFSVIGNSYFTGIVTALTFSGDGSQLTGIVASGIGIDIRDDDVSVGVITTFNFGEGIEVTPITSGISTIFISYSPVAGIATYAINAGVSTYAEVSGIATYASVAGVATYAPSAGVATYAPVAGVATYAPVAGVATYAPVAGVATYATLAGVSTLSEYASLSGIATNVIGGIASVTNLNVSGVATLAQLTVGVITASTFSGDGSELTNVIGLSTQWITNSVGLHTFSKVGIGTTAPLYNLHVNGEVVISAGNSTPQHIKIKAYEEDGGALSFEGSTGQLLSVSNNLEGTIFGVNNISGIPIVEVDSNGTISLAESGGNVGLGSTNPTSKLYVVGDGYFTGVVTATTFYGDGSNLTGLSAGISSVSEYAKIAGIATYAEIAGIATYASASGIATYSNTSGISTLALGFSTTASINTTGIITASTFVGSGSTSYRVTVPVLGEGDPFYDNVALLLHMDGANGSTTFTDTSKNNLSITRTGNVAISTSQSKFGGASAYFDGTGDYLNLPSSSDLIMGTGDFTIEVWLYRESSSIFGVTAASTYNASASFRISDNNMILDSQGVTNLIINTTVPKNQWIHVAVTRSSNIVRFFLNGIQQGTNQTFSTNFSGQINVIGQLVADNCCSYQGYMDDLRITKGVARYTSNFTPPTSAFLEGFPIITRNLQLSDLDISNNYLNGNLGIGTTQPSAKLDVRGDVNISGVVTALNFVGNLTGTATTANTSEYAKVSGISTYSNTSGISTYANSSGVSTSTIGGIVDVSNLNVSGVSTLGTVSVSQLFSSGIVTAFKFVGDGSLLTGVIPSSTAGINISNNDTNVGVALTINFGRYLNVSPTSAGIVTVTTPSSIPTGISKNSTPFVATEGQTSFATNYVVGNIEVFLNGIRLSESEYIADDGEVILLNEGASENDLLEVVNSQILFIPFGDYGDLGQVETDAFGIPISPSFDALTDPPATVAVNDLGQLV